MGGEQGIPENLLSHVVGQVQVVAEYLIKSGKQTDLQAVEQELKRIARNTQRKIGATSVGAPETNSEILAHVKRIWNQIAQQEKLIPVAPLRDPIELIHSQHLLEEVRGNVRALLLRARTQSIAVPVLRAELEKIALAVQRKVGVHLGENASLVDRRVLNLVFRIWNTEKDESLGYEQVLVRNTLPSIQWVRPARDDDQPERRILAPSGSISVMPSAAVANQKRYSTVSGDYETYAESVNCVEISGMITLSGDQPMKLAVTGATTRGEREINQDLLLVTSMVLQDGTHIGLLRIWDGAGGHWGGAKTSEELAKAELKYLTALSPAQLELLRREAKAQGMSFGCHLMKCALESAAQIAHTALKDEIGKSTVSGGWVINGEFVVGTRGDSKTFVIRDKTILLQTVDHTLVDYMIRNGAITEEERGNNPRRNVLMQSATDISEEDPVVYSQNPLQYEPFNVASVLLLPGDIIFTMCDGVAGKLPRNSAKLIEMLLKLHEMSATTIVHSFSAGSGDNDTFASAQVV